MSNNHPHANRRRSRDRGHNQRKVSVYTNCFGCCLCKSIPEEPDAYLYAFDFDHTIVDQNSDTAVMEVIHDPVPATLQRMFDGTNWEEYMEGVFKFVADEGGTYETIASKISELQPTEGMPHLLHKIVASRNFNHLSKLIVISDANTFFIETYLSSLKPPVIPDTLITNKAEKTEEGYLKLTPYENQNQCPFCPHNLCKGAALTRYILRKGPFSKVYYTGDGGNDICPAVRLTENDVVFVRRNFAMDKIIKHGVWKGKQIHVRAKVVLWDDADTIEQEMSF